MPGILGSNFNGFIMKVLDNFLAKIGRDKFEHHNLGGLICSFVSIVAILQDGVINWATVLYVIIGAVVTLFTAIIKEYVIDVKADWRDIVATVSGCIWPFIAVVFGVLFNQLSV